MKKLPLKVAHNQPHFFFSIANRPKTSPNLIFCSIKISPCATLYATLFSSWMPFSSTYHEMVEWKAISLMHTQQLKIAQDDQKRLFRSPCSSGKLAFSAQLIMEISTNNALTMLFRINFIEKKHSLEQYWCDVYTSRRYVYSDSQ